MRRLANESKPAVAIEADVITCLVQVLAVQFAYRRAVSARGLHVAATDAQSKLAGSEPVGRVAPIARNRDVHLTQQALYKIGAETGIVIDGRQTGKTGADPLEHNDLAL